MVKNSGEGQKPFFSNPGDIPAEFPFTICVEQLLALAVRLPVRGLTPEHKNVRFMTNPPFDDAANLSNQPFCVGTSDRKATSKYHLLILKRAHDYALDDL